MPSEYERQVAEARRRQAMAEALEAQAYRPLSGSDAPAPAAAPLVSALQSFMSARQRKKAMEAATKAEEMESTAGKQIAGRLRGGYVYDPKAATPAAIPEQTELEEFQPTSQYRQDVEGALNMAMTPVGTAAMKRAPLLAAALEKSMTPSEAEEYYAPVVDESGKYIQFGKRGGTRTSTVAAKKDETKGSQLAQLIAERDNLPPDSPLRSVYNDAISKETTRAPAPVTNIDLGPKDTFKLEADLRGEVKDKLKEYEAVRSSYQKIENALKTGAGDIAVVYAFAKLNDPTSVVRESEFATVAKSGSLGQRIKNLVEQAQSGKMNPELRENLRQQAQQMYLSQQANAESIINQYRDLATTYKLDPNKVLAGINVNNLAAKANEDVIDLPSRPRGRGR
jgi:hypothetical protein